MTRPKSPIRRCSNISGGTSIPPIPAGNSWTGAPSIAVSFFTTMPSSSTWRRHPNRHWKSPIVSPNPIVTEILPLTKFFPAEDYHQDYYKTHAVKYKYYRWNSGRDQFLQKVWGGEAQAARPASGTRNMPSPVMLNSARN